MLRVKRFFGLLFDLISHEIPDCVINTHLSGERLNIEPDNNQRQLRAMPVVNNVHEPLYQELKLLIDAYKGGIASLSLKIQVSKPTLWRWAKLKNRRAPNPGNVLAMLKYLKKENDLQKLIHMCSPQISQFLKESYQLELQRQKSSQISEQLNELFKDFYLYFIYRLIITEKKVDREFIKKVVGIYNLEQLGLTIEDESISDSYLKELGVIADHKINLLISYGVVVESSGQLIGQIKEPQIHISITKKHIPKLFSFFKEYNLSKNNNMLYLYYECINKETLKKVMRIQYDAFKKCYEIMDAEKCEDGEVYLLNTFVESISN